MESSKTMRNVSKVSAHNPSHSSYTMPPPQIFIFMFYLKFLLISSVTPLAYSATLTFVNNCTYHVWPAIWNRNSIKLRTTGFSLRPGEAEEISVENWIGTVWGRTLCTQNSTNGNFSCVTGDCGSTDLECPGGNPNGPVTLAEFAFNNSNGLDFYDVSLVDGYNLPMTITPQGGSSESCEMIGCVNDLNSKCPLELMMVAGAQGDVVGCKSACDAFNEAKYCCTGAYSKPDTCRPNSYSAFFKAACPTAYSYAYDDRTSTFTCVGADYLINFCPSPTTR